MALTDEEQRLLAQMEAALAEDDPDLAHTMSSAAAPPPVGAVLDRRRLALGGVALVVGLGLLVLGLSTHPLVSVLGFLVMLGGALAALGGVRLAEQTPFVAPPTDDQIG